MGQPSILSSRCASFHHHLVHISDHVETKRVPTSWPDERSSWNGGPGVLDEIVVNTCHSRRRAYANNDESYNISSRKKPHPQYSTRQRAAESSVPGEDHITTGSLKVGDNERAADPARHWQGDLDRPTAESVSDRNAQAASKGRAEVVKILPQLESETMCSDARQTRQTAQLAQQLAQRPSSHPPREKEAGQSDLESQEHLKRDGVLDSARSHDLEGDDAETRGAHKYSLCQNGLFPGDLVSRGTIIVIDGEDYVMYSVLKQGCDIPE
ncbi:uncharacterized protein B0I36DRAFT_356466 [Microdochium trichocladiopsis]|uniref:Uncharacterized protein n=1 Tax=Microdochium trichocladiopsis TaxID=1682393 RepID=A0A9P8XQA7_9PEZI|nr:uncharacterized protein B0I36DRAFT_356466 [Microdochium trichocladiopsis]KAH7010869.1 hypothetical protein B0I36DRAFT_356466 [Microdochium trichocladiopsis]